jgi:hypothetical protein|tara:strand:+ start:783 stop:995 length:213 start_codon:yes stop_codon:yes gene_type:complete
MSDYYLEMFTADGKYIIKDSEGSKLSEPLVREDALRELAALANEKYPELEEELEEIEEEEGEEEDVGEEE